MIPYFIQKRKHYILKNLFKYNYNIFIFKNLFILDYIISKIELFLLK